jgi:hypothetical protein
LINIKQSIAFSSLQPIINYMAEITTVTLNQLNSLTRGAEVSAVQNNTSANNPQSVNSVVANVVVSQVSAKTVTLTNPQNKQSVELPANVLSSLGNVKAGQSFELVSIPNKPNTYALVPATLANRQNTLISPQAQTLASTKVNVNDNQLTAIVSKASTNGEIGLSGKPVVNIAGRVTAISANQVSLSFAIPGSNLPPQQAQITLTKAQVSNLNTNINVSIAVDVSAKQAKIISLSTLTTQGQSLTNSTITLSPQLAQLNSGVLPTKLISTAILQQVSNHAQLSSPAQTNQAANQVSTQVSTQVNTQTRNLNLPLTQLIIPLTDAKLAELPKTLVSSLQTAISKVNTTGASQVSLVIESSGNTNSLKLSVVGNLNKTSLELNTSQVRALIANVDTKASLSTNSVDASKSLTTDTRIQTNASGTQTSNRISTNSNPDSIAAALSNAIAKQGFIANRADLLLANQLSKAGANDAVTNPNVVSNTTPNAVTGEQQSAQNFKTNVLLDQLSKYISLTSQTAKPGATSTNLDGLKTQVQALIAQTANQSASQTQTLANIISALNNEADIDVLSTETQTLLRTIREQLPVTNTQTTPIDARTIQQLVGAPLNTPPINAISPTATSGFLSGLVTLLQVSLATQLQRQSNKQASKIQDQIPDIVKSVVPSIQKTQSAKLMQDFQQFDAKHTLSAEVAKMLFSHQHHKLKSIESSLQGQDQLYYALPNTLSKNADDIELLIKRESKENKNAQGKQNISSWYLTMKLDVGPLGQMLAKTQLSEDEIKLQLYTSTTELKNKALDMLPFLQRRLSALGINITEKSCQLGKIPKQLKSEHYQVFETQV